MIDITVIFKFNNILALCQSLFSYLIISFFHFMIYDLLEWKTLLFEKFFLFVNHRLRKSVK